MSENENCVILKEALDTNLLTEASEKLQMFKERILNAEDPFFDENDLELIFKISSKFGYQLALEIGKIYKVLSEVTPRSEPNTLFKLCCDMHLISEKLNGTDLGYVLKEIYKHELSNLSLSPSISSEKQQIIKQIINSTTTVIQAPTIETIVQDLKENNPFGMNRLMDYFCSMDSIRDQYLHFATIMNPVIEVLEQNLSTEEGIDREILLKLSELLEHFVFRYNFNVQISSYDSASPLYSQPYTIYEIKLLSIYHEILESIIALLNIVKSADILITQNLVNILHRIWNIFPLHRSVIYDLIYGNFKEIAAGGTEEVQIYASQFLHKIMNDKETSAEFKGKLESEDLISKLFQIDTGEEVIFFEGGESSDIDNLQIKVGFPLCTVIPSGHEWSHLVEVPESKCILSWGFATENYDLSFTLERVDLPSPEVIISHQKVRCDETPCSGIRILNSSGLYKFTWSNSYSWFRAKHLRYKIFLLRPVKPTKPKPPQNLAHIINIINESNDFDETNSLEIGVQIKDKMLRLSALDPSPSDTPNYILEEVLYKSTEEISLCISDFVEDFIKNSEVPINSVKIGVVMKNVTKVSGLEEIGSVAIAKDIHAVALLSQDNLHCHTLIVVMNEDGLRSCVVHRGKILMSEEGVSLGDLEFFKEIDPAQGIGILLCMFGPAVVVLTGEGFSENLAAFLSKIRPFVPPDIWKKSTIRESIFKTAASVQAAAKLHYLHEKFKFGM